MTREVIVDASTLSREEWLKYRKAGIGGSDAAKVLGMSKWGSPLDLYMDKTTTTLPDEPDNWFQLDFGNLVEPLVRKWYAKATGYKVTNDTNMYRHPEYPFMLADVDFTAETPTGEIIGGEIKTTSARGIDEWTAGVLGSGGRMPYQYEVQVRHYMAVLDINRFVVICVFGNHESDIVPVQVYRDLIFESQLIAAESEFWNNHVVPRIAPEGGISKETLALVRKEVGADASDEPLVLDATTSDLLDSFLTLKEQKKEAEKVVSDLTEQINAKTAEIVRVTAGHKEATLPIGDGSEFYHIKNNTVHKTLTDSKALKLNFPDVYELVKTESSYDTTAVKIKKAKPARKGAAS